LDKYLKANSGKWFPVSHLAGELGITVPSVKLSLEVLKTFGRLQIAESAGTCLIRFKFLETEQRIIPDGTATA